MVCPLCGKTLTASRSKGHLKYYSYYHCTGDCKFRANSETVNETFDNKLKKYTPKKEYLNLYAYVIMEQYNKRTSGVNREKRQLISRIKDYESRLSNARDLLAKGEIEPSDYREMKSDYNRKIEELERKLSETENESLDVEGLLNEGMERLLNLNYTCKCDDMDDRFGEVRDVISSIFPEKMVFSDGTLRTNRLNNIVECIYMENKEIEQKKDRTKIELSSLSCQVDLSKYFSNNFIHDLKKLAKRSEVVSVQKKNKKLK